MDLNDRQYRGFLQYNQELEKEKESIKFRRAIRQANIENDKLETVRIVCDIDEDWVKNVEEGLLYVEKAIREERQFIRVEGEVVPIERAKHISKTTITHLAKHSNFITHVPKNPKDDLVPNKLYIVEKESDYAVYENRFIYMMLTYLRDFIAIRLNKIRDKMTTYYGKLTMDKEVNLSHRKLNYTIALTEIIKDDPILIEKYKAIKMIDRIELQYHFVLSLLATDLMEQVSKTPMIKPPIIKTNTLKMNTNFKTALALYDYIASYNKQGYSFTEEKIDLAPLSDDIAEDYASVTALNSFLTYKNVSGISKDLKQSFLQNEKLLKEQEEAKTKEKLKRLRRHINESNINLEEYLVILEDHNRNLEKDIIVLDTLTSQVKDLEDTIKTLQEEKSILIDNVDFLKVKLEEKDLEVKEITQKAATDLLVLEQIHRKEIADLNAKHQKEILDLNNKHALEIADLINKHNNEIEKLNDEHRSEIERINASYKQEITNINEKYTNEILEINNKHNLEITNLNNEHEINKKAAIEEATKSLIEEKEKIITKHNKEVMDLNDDIITLNNTILKNKQTYQTNLTEKEEKLDEALDAKKRMINDYEDKIFNLMKAHREQVDDLNKEIDKRVKEIKDINKENNKQNEIFSKQIDHLVKERLFVEAQLHAIRMEQGKISDEYDYTSKERFEELEKQYMAFKQLFKKEWNKTKKKIRQEILSKENNSSINKEETIDSSNKNETDKKD